MKLDDFLKCKKVRCVDGDGCNDLTIGKEYEITKLSVMVHIIDDDDGEYSYQARRFEPVLDSAENPLQNIELTPEFEAVEPTFKVGDKVYVGLTGRIAQVTEIIDDYVVSVANKNNDIRAWVSNICHATPENYERLQATFPNIKFEAPPKPLTGSDLARAMLDKGWKYMPCFVSNESDDFAQKMKLTDLIIALDGDRSKEFVGDDVWHFAVPFDPRTGEPLTESVLND